MERVYALVPDGHQRAGFAIVEVVQQPGIVIGGFAILAMLAVAPNLATRSSASA